MKFDNMFNKLEKINQRPKLYEFYTAEALWTDEHISKKMLQFHLDDTNDLASRNKNAIYKAVDWINSRFNINNNTTICDFGCGPGLYTTLLAQKGAKVTGIDFSKRSIEYAKKTAEKNKLQIDYINEDYLKFTTDKKFDFITFIYYDLCPLNPMQREALIKKFYEYLEFGGKIILDVLSLNFYDKANEKNSYEYTEGDGFWAANPYYIFSNTFKYEDEKVLLDKYVIFEENRTREIYNWLQCYSLESLERDLEKNGFRITEHYSDILGTPYKKDSTEFAVVAEKV